MISQTMLLAVAAGVLLMALGERVARLWRPRAGLLDRPVIFFLVVCGCLFALRLPQMNCPQAVNVDEAQFLAQAMRFRTHPVPWRDVDGTTSGPLISMLLDVPLYIGATADWRLARVTLWVLHGLTLVLLYLGLRRFGGRVEAQVALIPTILFYAFAKDKDFNHYSSETLPVLLLSASWCLLAWEWTADKPSRARLFGLGLLAGSIPFVKLQAGPLALFLVVAALALAFFRRRGGAGIGSRLVDAGMLSLGGLLVPAVILGCVAAAGSLRDFWISYILSSGSYVSEHLPGSRWHVWLVLFTKPDFLPYSLCAVVALGLLWATRLQYGAREGGKWSWPFAVVSAGAGLTLLCVSAPGRAFAHYLVLLAPPLAGLTGLAFFSVRERLMNPAAGQEAAARRWLVIGMLLMLAPMAGQPFRYVFSVSKDYPPDPPLSETAVANRIRAVTRPGDTLSVWGHMPSYYVEAGLPPATRDAVCHYVITPGPYWDYFRARYLADSKQSKPAVFVDAVADGTFVWWSWKHGDGFESFPELAAYVDANYSLWWSIYLTKDGIPVRIYVRKDRMQDLQLKPNNEGVLATSPPAM